MVIWRRTDHLFYCTMLKIPRFFSGSCWTMKQRPLVARWSGTTAHAHKERWLGVTWRDLALEKAIMSGDIDLGKHGACALRACTLPRGTKSHFKISVMEHIDSYVACFQKKLNFAMRKYILIPFVPLLNGREKQIKVFAFLGKIICFSWNSWNLREAKLKVEQPVKPTDCLYKGATRWRQVAANVTYFFSIHGCDAPQG